MQAQRGTGPSHYGQLSSHHETEEAARRCLEWTGETTNHKSPVTFTSTCGQIKQKVSPVKHPVFARRREATEDFDKRCPERAEDASKKRIRAEPAPQSSVSKKLCVLKKHSDADRIGRVNALIAKNVATVGFFVEMFPDPDIVEHPDERWFMQVTNAKISNGEVRAKWCQADSLTVTETAECRVQMATFKDYAERSKFV